MGRTMHLVKFGLLICLSFVIIGFIASNVVIMRIGKEDTRQHVNRAVDSAVIVKLFSSPETENAINPIVPGAPCVEIGVIAELGNWTIEETCPRINCTVKTKQTLKYSEISETDAVYFQKLSSSISEWKQYMRQRKSGHIWIFVTYESPRNTPHLALPRLYKDAFNWDVTYRTDSTFISPYGRYLRYGTHDTIKADGNILPELKKNGTLEATVMWMSSNCFATSWPRTKFVRLLSEYIKIDTYGRCGRNICPRGPECANIIKKYKFYLSFENSECTDYITEKFWDPLSHDVIPVVYGPPREDYEKVAPPNSFIHVQDFRNFSDLANYLKRVDQNVTLFNQYFQWKKTGYIEANAMARNFDPKLVFCRVAEKILNWKKTGKGRVGTLDLRKSWGTSCEDKNILGNMLGKY